MQMMMNRLNRPNTKLITFHTNGMATMQLPTNDVSANSAQSTIPKRLPNVIFILNYLYLIGVFLYDKQPLVNRWIQRLLYEGQVIPVIAKVYLKVGGQIALSCIYLCRIDVDRAVSRTTVVVEFELG